MRDSAPRVVVLAVVTAIMGALAPAAWSAPRVVSADLLTVSADSAKRQSCATRAVTGASVARRTVTAPADGIVDVRMSGAGGSDWDLALLDASGKVLDGGAGLGTRELSNTFVRKGQAITIQACRRFGAAGAVNLAVRFIATDKATAGAGYAVKLVRVPLATRLDHDRLSGLDLDTTDHPAPDHQDVILWSAADEQKLRDAGFSFSVEVADVAAKDVANRRFEQQAKRSPALRARAARALPSGRTTYRTLTEINDELKSLAEDNSTFVKLFALPGKSIEGRDILGVEIADGVGAAGDGRPSLVVVGTHHAREWPANEAAIEWAYELVNGFNGGDARLSNIVKSSRNFVIPVFNVDGFDVTIKSEGLYARRQLRGPAGLGRRRGRPRHRHRLLQAQELPQAAGRHEPVARDPVPGAQLPPSATTKTTAAST